MSIKTVAILCVALAATFAGVHLLGHSKASAFRGVSSNQNGGHYVPNMVMLFSSYKKANNLTFGAAEENTRFKIFESNYKIIEAHNSLENSTYKLGLTSLSHLTREEFASIKLGLGPKGGNQMNPTIIVPKGIPESVNWVTKGAVTNVKNQGQCGACWSFSAVGALEGLNAIVNHKLISLSEQQLIDCSTPYGNQGCGGGFMGAAFKYTEIHGISSEADYPFSGVDEPCRKEPIAFQNKGYKNVVPNNLDQLVAAVAQQPVSVAIEADSSAFQLYASGVLTSDACGTSLDHGVLAVGYGTENNTPYFIVKNSWGAEWGQNGYILIGRTQGRGVCGINEDASYPTV